MSEIGVHREGSGRDVVEAIDRPIGRRRSDRIVGASRASREIVDQAMAAAQTDFPVIITGPDGTGKQHTGRAIHAWSDRASQPFVSVSCAAVSEALVARELFGCADGAYPLLPGDYPGALARAAGGTLLVDRVDRLSNAVLHALADAVKKRIFRREGDSADSALRARLVVTSIVQPDTSPFGDTPQHTIRVAPLAERSDDILPLAAHFLRLYADEEGIKPVGFTSDARDALVAEEWSGNVGELAERIRQAIKLAGSGSISAEALLLAGNGDDIPSFKEAKRAFETRYVVGLLRRCSGNISRAARLAKKDRKDFYDVIRRTGIDPSDFR